MTGPHATRVRKARAKSVCALCPELVKIGNLIGKLPAGGWAHVACIAAAQRASQTSAASPAAAAPSTEGTIQ